jgi:hypothetical protein
MKRVLAFIVILLAVVGGALGCWFLWQWTTKPRLTPEEEIRAFQRKEFEETTGSGHMGSVQSGIVGKEWQGYVPFYRDGPLMVYAPQAGFAGGPRGPVFVLITRLQFGAPFQMASGITTDGQSVRIEPAQYDGKGQEWRFSYLAEGEPVRESFAVREAKYDPNKGRVFLLDLTQDTPTVRQLKSDLEPLFPARKGDLTQQDLRAAVTKLATEHDEVKAFLQEMGKLKSHEP